MEEKEKKVRSIRIDDNTFERFKSLCDELGGQNSCMENLINAYEIGNSKAILSGMQTDIDDFESHINSIQKAFLHILDLNNNAEQRIRQEFISQLNSKDKLIENLQERSETAERIAEQTKDDCDGQLQNYSLEIQDLKKQLKKSQEEFLNKEQAYEQAEKSLSDKNDIISSLKFRLEEAERAANESNEIKSRLSESLEAQRQADIEVQRLKAENESIKHEKEIAIDTARREREYAEKESELKLKVATTEVKEKYLEVIETLRTEHQEAIKSISKEKQELLKANNELKDRIRELEKINYSLSENKKSK